MASYPSYLKDSKSSKGPKTDNMADAKIGEEEMGRAEQVNRKAGDMRRAHYAHQYMQDEAARIAELSRKKKK